MAAKNAFIFVAFVILEGRKNTAQVSKISADVPSSLDNREHASNGSVNKNETKFFFFQKCKNASNPKHAAI